MAVDLKPLKTYHFYINFWAFSPQGLHISGCYLNMKAVFLNPMYSGMLIEGVSSYLLPVVDRAKASLKGDVNFLFHLKIRNYLKCYISYIICYILIYDMILMYMLYT